jgi:GT2 family glycosyltransferase
VIIPTYGRPRHLADCLDALAESDWDSFEVIVVDDGSDPPVEPIVRNASCSGLTIRYVRQENRGCGPAKQHGASLASADVVLFTDDDCRPAPDWVRRLTDAIEREPDALVGGAVVNGLTENIYSDVSQDLATFLLDQSERSAEGEVSYFTGNNIGCSRDTFEAVGGFNEQFSGAADDRELGLRWRATGRPLRYEPEATVIHYHDLTFKGFWRQHVHYGRGINRLRSGVTKQRHHFSGPRLYLDLLLHPIRKKRPGSLRRIGLNLLSQVATTYGMVRGDSSRRTAVLPAPWRGSSGL